MEDKSINTHRRIVLDADFVDQAFHVAQAAKSSHEITVTITSLTYIARSGSIDEELRLLKYILSIVRFLDLAGEE